MKDAGEKMGAQGMSDAVPHQILCRNVTAVRERIERKLGVETRAEPAAGGGWAVMFYAPADIDLDFLRPDVLPPRNPVKED